LTHAKHKEQADVVEYLFQDVLPGQLFSVSRAQELLPVKETEYSLDDHVVVCSNGPAKWRSMMRRLVLSVVVLGLIAVPA